MVAIERAMALHQAGNLAEAERAYREALAAEPDRFEALHFLGLLEAQRGRLAEARPLMARSLEINPTVPDAFVNYARVLQNLGLADDAIAACGRALALAPNHPAALVIRSNALKDLGRLDEALASARAARAAAPGFVVAAAAEGDALQALGRHADALACYQHAIDLNPGFAQIWCNRAAALNALGRHQDAVASCDRALAVDPGLLPALVARGAALNALGRREEALAAYRQVLAVRPSEPEIIRACGEILHHLGRYGDAIDCYRQALAHKRDYADAHSGLAAALAALDRYEEALIAVETALMIAPNSPGALFNHGVVLHELGRHEDALAAYRSVLALQPDRADANWNEAAVRLSLGDLPGGFAKYEWRWKASELRDRLPRERAAAWRGEDVAGRTLLVLCEQGMGDTIQFARYLPLLAARGARVTFFCDDRVIRLLRPVTAGIEVVSSLPADRRFDFQCALVTLPLVFATELATIPASVPYLSAEDDLVARWRDRIGREGFKVGIVWQGNPAGNVDRGRSVPLAHYAPLARVPGVRLISLQKVHGLDQLARMPAEAGIENLGAELDNGADWYVETAAAMESLDLIVTSDTSTAHLAGALARPTWVALKQVADWRWLTRRADCPWYPTMRLFRQTSRGDWGPVFADMARELARTAADAVDPPTTVPTPSG